MSYTPGIGGDPAQLAQRISSNIQKITQCSAEIQRTLNQLGTPQDSPELRQQLQQKQQYTNQLAKETDKYIKEFGSLPTTPSEQRQRKIQKDRLVDEFTTSLTNFQKVQRQAAEKEKEFVARVRASSRVSGGFPEESSKEKNLVSWESQTQPQVQVQDEEITEDDLRLIHERESSIRQLEADIMDINEIFKDLGMMIHEQGDMIDSIEANVENAEVHVQQANQQLSRAADYQSRPAFANTMGDAGRSRTDTSCSGVTASPAGLLGPVLPLQVHRARAVSCDEPVAYGRIKIPVASTSHFHFLP